MKAAQILGPQRISPVEVPQPSPRDGECLIHLQYFSVCGSDVRRGFRRVLPEDRYPLSVGFPGHECAGVIVESGNTALREGQRVLVHPAQGDGLAEYIVATPSRVAIVPDHGDLAEWLMCQPAATAIVTYRQIGSVLGKRVVVLGQGSIGLCHTMILERLGARQIIVADLEDYRLEWGKKLGATHTLNARNASMVSAVEELTDGNFADVVVEAAGELDTILLAPRLLAIGGTVAFFGLPDTVTAEVDFEMLHSRQVRAVSSAPGRIEGTGALIQDMIDLVDRGWINPGQFITHRLPFTKMQRAFEMYDRREDNIIKVVMSHEEV